MDDYELLLARHQLIQQQLQKVNEKDSSQENAITAVIKDDLKKAENNKTTTKTKSPTALDNNNGLLQKENVHSSKHDIKRQSSKESKTETNEKIDEDELELLQMR